MYTYVYQEAMTKFKLKIKKKEDKKNQRKKFNLTC